MAFCEMHCIYIVLLSKVLCDIASHSLVHTFVRTRIHALTVVSTTQASSQLVGGSRGSGVFVKAYVGLAIASLLSWRENNKNGRMVCHSIKSHVSLVQPPHIRAAHYVWNVCSQQCRLRGRRHSALLCSLLD